VGALAHLKVFGLLFFPAQLCRLFRAVRVALRYSRVDAVLLLLEPLTHELDPLPGFRVGLDLVLVRAFREALPLAPHLGLVVLLHGLLRPHELVRARPAAHLLHPLRRAVHARPEALDLLQQARSVLPRSRLLVTE
jgi:hypothetical protein